MKTAEKIAKVIGGLPEGRVFTYQDLGVRTTEYAAAAKALGRLVMSGNLRRAKTGMFYKAQKTVFGELQPAEEQLLRPYLFERNKRVAYITGTALYNRMGLTTQVPRIIRIASRGKRVIAKAGNLRIQAVKSYVEVTDDNYYLLETLDAMKDFKTIPDTNKESMIIILKKRIAELKKQDLNRIACIALEYPPRVRAFLGALLEVMELVPLQQKELKATLNPLSAYQFGIGKGLLPTADNWNIY
ncbi:DUF6088 family protein [Sediminibacterium ginsengisoli]|uniref:Transcriptional regulator, AbiEi antitoxin, Type IV TA system n=1 Tax=Sediminibacterium ginsengisoli TaxID=413434 RepID=A0A1T4P0Y8_9BACT|nr:DUF6088 family protein [Sediminibacterium ginsengisoli]SJZ84906.1 hypothetical protein SAMN04488132_10580 [Sediminibacterium ginsengisoli]